MTGAIDQVDIEPKAAEELAAAFRGELVRPDDPSYEEHRRVWNGSALRSHFAGAISLAPTTPSSTCVRPRSTRALLIDSPHVDEGYRDALNAYSSSRLDGGDGVRVYGRGPGVGLSAELPAGLC